LHRIIQVYFKHVYSQNSEIVDVAHEGLRDVLSHQARLPKEVLQSGLRPILVNLADAKRLSVSGLDGLARFLELLTNYFKVEIGVKLLDHFETLGDQQMLAKAAFSPLLENQDISRMSRLVNIFGLLPSTAVTYLKDLTQKVVDVEASLHQSVPGPFTEHFARYLNRYHVEATQNLLDNITNPRYVWTYRNVIASGKAPQLVEAISDKAEALCKTCFQDPENFSMVIPGLELLRELSRTSETWFCKREPILEALVGVWRSIMSVSRYTKIDMSSVHYQQVPALLMELFMTSLKQQRHIPLMFHLVEALECRSSFERSSVQYFLYQEVALHESVEYRREVLDQFFKLYDEEIVTWAFKANGLRLIVNPTLRTYFADPNNDGSIVPASMVARIANQMWRPLANTQTAKQREDSLLIEVYALTTLLVQHCTSKVNESRKDVFKLAWMGINLLEPTVKLMAYILTARFMATFETPVKFVRLTWTGLLRLKDNENRVLYRQAIDTLASSLPVRDSPPQSGTPEWAQRVRSVLIEEGHATGQLVTVCELLVNHPDLFYDYRELYVPQVASSLHKLAFVQAATAEMKKLTVDIVELIFKWEKRRMAAKDEAMEIDDTVSSRKTRQGSVEPSPHKKQRLDRAGTAASSASGSGWAAPGQVRELVTAHLLRLVSTSPEPVARGGLTTRALDLFKEILGPKGLPNVNVKLGFFTRTMTQVSCPRFRQ
jgi:transformation/transcription domain-associated protein